MVRLNNLEHWSCSLKVRLFPSLLSVRKFRLWATKSMINTTQWCNLREIFWFVRYDLSSLRILGTVGEPINPEAWQWYYEVVGQSRCPIVDTFWQTETVRNKKLTTEVLLGSRTQAYRFRRTAESETTFVWWAGIALLRMCRCLDSKMMLGMRQ